MMDRRLIGGKKQPKAEEPQIAFPAAEGAGEKQQMQQGFAYPFSSRAADLSAAAVGAN